MAAMQTFSTGGEVPSWSAPRVEKVVYSGTGMVTVDGPVTGIRYEFRGGVARAVDGRDAPQMLGSPYFRRAVEVR
jgi:hypothetical protein